MAGQPPYSLLGSISPSSSWAENPVALEAWVGSMIQGYEQDRHPPQRFIQPAEQLSRRSRRGQCSDQKNRPAPSLWYWRCSLSCHFEARLPSGRQSDLDVQGCLERCDTVAVASCVKNEIDSIAKHGRGWTFTQYLFSLPGQLQHKAVGKPGRRNLQPYRQPLTPLATGQGDRRHTAIVEDRSECRMASRTDCNAADLAWPQAAQWPGLDWRHRA